MALPTDLDTLNYTDGGLPFVQWSKPATDGLDVVDGGLPFWAAPTVPPDYTLAAGQNTVTLTAPSTYIKPLDRTFPLMREEDQRISQRVSHIFPVVAIQNPALIP